MKSKATSRTESFAVGLICAVAVVILFSSFTIISRLGVSSRLAPPDLAALRFGIGGTVLLPILIRHGLRGLRWYVVAVLAVLGGLGFALSAYAGFARAAAAHGAVLLHGTLPLFTSLIIAITVPGAIRRRQWLGIALIFIGVAMMVGDSISGIGQTQLICDVCLLLAAALWSGYGVLVQRLGLPAASAAAMVAVFSMATYLPVYAMLPNKMIFDAAWSDILLQGVFQGVLIGAVSIFVYTRAVSALGANQMSIFAATVPCLTTLGGAVLLAEVPSIGALAGVLVVTLGMLIGLPRNADSPHSADKEGQTRTN